MAAGDEAKRAEMGGGSQEPGARSQEPGARSQEPGARLRGHSRFRFPILDWWARLGWAGLRLDSTPVTSSLWSYAELD
ncbi:hypothetical protein VTL71DRAFT_5647 [Oculimacula yallundae]|uniref:Uncharacterized protein n=1 Tax=Oculimacula yallundae TaxID=86028 RepID=A0ABR4BY39_9HELO